MATSRAFRAEPCDSLLHVLPDPSSAAGHGLPAHRIRGRHRSAQFGARVTAAAVSTRSTLCRLVYPGVAAGLAMVTARLRMPAPECTSEAPDTISITSATDRAEVKPQLLAHPVNPLFGL